jgi:SRSO17 transposase
MRELCPTCPGIVIRIAAAGTATAGVHRQYTGTAGRVENAQVAVYLG